MPSSFGFIVRLITVYLSQSHLYICSTGTSYFCVLLNTGLPPYDIVPVDTIVF